MNKFENKPSELTNRIFKIVSLFAVVLTFGFTTLDSKKENHSDFELNYLFSGLGSNLEKLNPNFSIKGKKFTYVLRQTGSWSGKYTLKPDTVITGEIRDSSRDSIINLVKNIKDTVVEDADYNVMSGGYFYVSVKNNSVNVSFQLLNIHNPIAERIVGVLNTYIPENKRKLGIFPKKNK